MEQDFRKREIQELNQDISHIDKEFKMLARAKSKTYEKLIGNLESLFEEEILQVKHVEDVEMTLSHDPESMARKNVKVNIEHDLEGEMSYQSFDEKRREIMDEVRKIITRPVEEPDFDLYIDVRFGDVELKKDDD